MSDQSLLLLCGFGAVALLTYWVMSLLMTSDDKGKMRSRLQGKELQSGSILDKKAANRSGGGMGTLIQQLGQAASKPFMPSSREKQSAMQRELKRAGVYSASALRVMQGTKFIGVSGGVLIGYILSLMLGDFLMYTSLGGLFGYLAPKIWLMTRVKKNQRALDYGLADAMDLMVVCVEAGLTVDASMQRVGEELALVHPAISREFGIAHMETRVGLPRSEALRNLGVRTGNASLMSLAAMLNQADRFGTSIAQALRIHAESLRLARHHKAEEMAAKSAVKLSFPLVLFIFPATFIVLMGPVVIQLMNSPFMK
jgi:tight adherence protein C